MYQALKLKYPDEDIPSERTVYRIMEETGLSHRPNRKPCGITKAGRNARKSDDLLKCDFTAEKPLEKCVTDNRKRELCVSTIEHAHKAFPSISGAIIQSDRGSQYTSALYRAELKRCGIVQSMNSDGGRCHDNAPRGYVGKNEGGAPRWRI